MCQLIFNRDLMNKFNTTYILILTKQKAENALIVELPPHHFGGEMAMGTICAMHVVSITK